MATNFRTRFWTRSEIKETLKECVKVGFELSIDNTIWTATDNVTGETVIRALILDGEKLHAVRINQSYFEA